MPQDIRVTDTTRTLIFNARDQGDTTAHTNGSWGDFQNAHACWEVDINAQRFNRSYTITIPQTPDNSLEFEHSVDDDVQVFIDGVQVFTDGASFRTQKRTIVTGIAPGNRTLSWTAQNGVGPSGGSGPGGLALLVYALVPGPVDGIGYTDQQLNTLLSNFESGKRIRASDIQAALSLYQDFITHEHDLLNYIVKDTFGTTAGDQTSFNTVQTLTVNGVAAKPADPQANTRITAADHAAFRNAFNSARTHTHNWDDT
jgi:archaellum component FlaG (FlaF/FlaG flagellin family)